MYSIHAPRNEYFVTHFDWQDERFNNDVKQMIKDHASLRFDVTWSFGIKLSDQLKFFPTHLDMDYEYDPLLSVTRTFEFERPRIGGLDSLVNLGLVNFKYSQRATPPEKPESVQTTQAWLNYVNDVCTNMKIDMQISNIKQINLVEGGYFEFVCTREDGEDKIEKDERQFTKSGPFKYDGSWPFWNYLYKTENAPKFESILKLKLKKVRMRSRFADEYHIKPVATVDDDTYDDEIERPRYRNPSTIEEIDDIPKDLM